MRSNAPALPWRRAPDQSYTDARAAIHDGDVLMYRGRSLVSRLIRFVTRSPYSHAGLAVWWNSRLMVMEAVGKGVVVTTLSANIRGYHGHLEWFAPLDPISPEDQKRMIRVAQEELGKEYARWRAILLGLRVLFHRDVETRDRLRRERTLFCSHYVAQVYNAIGRDLMRGVSDRFMSPADIARSPLLIRKTTLKHSR